MTSAHTSPGTVVLEPRVQVAPGRSIACDVAGTGAPIMLLHGIGGARAQWRPQLTALASGFRAIAPDARGYGDSDGPPVVRFRDFADDLFALMDAFGFDKVNAVGHSMGGRILLEACAIAPDRFTGLVLSGTQPAYLAHMSQAERQAYIDARHGLFDGESVRSDRVQGIVESLLHPTASPAARAQMSESLSGLKRLPYLAALTASAGMDRRDLLANLTMPVLVVGGDSDAVCPPAVTEALAAAVGQGPAQILKDVGHMPNLEAPDRFTKLVLEFFKGASESARGSRRRFVR
ncbi:alpha/beta fold hydrolase [Algihabitans albus]|uniref:alpha/beta fold hydrolase n=1 Tax=Algihabitans albus TaxID=2164067 RepID=UPI000E5D3BA9|nr:alpha/beta hydrolase [Algihabitans albus]